jgi:hypothetical protein
MTFFFIKIILWFPIFLIALVVGVIGNLLSRFGNILLPISNLFLKFNIFLLNLMINDLLHSAKNTPLYNHLEQMIKNLKNKQ